MKEFVIGDLHLFDENIRNFEGRPWRNVTEMNEALVANWNSVVGRDDKVFVNGDFFDFANCTYPEAEAILQRLHGNIVLIAGNHDMPYLDFYRNHGIEVIEYPIIYHNFWIISHEPMYVTVNAPYANIFAHVHNNPMYKTVSSRSYCVSAERISYTPILLKDIIDTVVKLATKEVT